MNVHFPARRRWPSRLAQLAVVIVVLALAAATFVLSYTGVHAIALQAGVPARLARIYPAIFDATLVIACVAALMLREGRWWARAYAWLSIILVIAAVGAADAVHAMNVALPHRKTAGVVAAVPWVLVLLGFSLLLTMLRQSRAQHVSQAPQLGPEPPASQPTAPEPTAPEPLASGPTAPRPATPRPAPPQPPEPLAAVSGLPAPEVTAPPEVTAGDEPASAGAPASAQQDSSATAGTTAEKASPKAAGLHAADQEESQGEAGPDGDGPDSAPAGNAESPESAESTGSQAASLDYWDTGNAGGAGGANPQPATAPAPPRTHRPPVSAVPGEREDEQEEPPPPFAAVPRLRRVRSTPTPPEDGEEDQ